MIILPELTLHQFIGQFLEFRPAVLKLERASESPEGLVKTQIPGPHLQSLGFSRSWAGLRMCISDMAPAVAVAVALRTTLGGPLLLTTLLIRPTCCSLGTALFDVFSKTFTGPSLCTRPIFTFQMSYLVLKTPQNNLNATGVFHSPLYLLSHAILLLPSSLRHNGHLFLQGSPSVPSTS